MKEMDDEKRESVWGKRKVKSLDAIHPAPKPSPAGETTALIDRLCPRCGVGVLSSPPVSDEDVCVACLEGWSKP